MLEIVSAEASAEIGREDLDKLRRELWRRLGGLPQRCDLALEKIEEVDLGDVVREVVRYQLEPGEWVSSYILRPKDIKEPLPGVLALHGHGANYATGKMEPADLWPKNMPYGPPAYYGWGLELARRGYVVICQDQICFESRNWKKTKFSDGSLHERFEGLSRLAQGRTLMGKVGFDISRQVDVLVSREDVLTERIGAMGHSGGGAKSYTGCLYDPRIKAIVSNCGICSRLAKLRNFRGMSLTSILPGLTELGDQAAAVACMVPRAVLLINGSEDWLFPTDGILNTYYRAKKAYAAMGLAQRLQLAIAEGPHLFGPERRDMGYMWLDRWLKETPIESSEVWYRNERPDPATVNRPRLDLGYLRKVCGSYRQKISEAKAVVRRNIQNGGGFLEEVRITVDHTVHFDNKRPALEPPQVASEYLADARGIADPSDYADVWVLEPPGKKRGKAGAVIVLHRSASPYEAGRDEVMGLDGAPEYAIGPELAERGRVVIAMDLPGHGSRKNPMIARRWPERPERAVLFPAWSYISTGTSILAKAIHDVRCVVSYLADRDDLDQDRIEIVGYGTGGLVGLLAAILEPRVSSVVAVGGITTQAAAIKSQNPDHFFLYHPGLLPAGDMGTALSHLAPRRCRLICFENDANWPIAGAREVAQAMRQAYDAAARPQALDVKFVQGAGPTKDLQPEILTWLQQD